MRPSEKEATRRERYPKGVAWVVDTVVKEEGEEERGEAPERVTKEAEMAEAEAAAVLENAP